jgi:hypothetical protein
MSLLNNNYFSPKNIYCDINNFDLYSFVGSKENEMKSLQREQIKSVFGGIWDVDNKPQEPELPTFEL